MLWLHKNDVKAASSSRKRVISFQGACPGSSPDEAEGFHVLRAFCKMSKTLGKVSITTDPAGGRGCRAGIPHLPLLPPVSSLPGARGGQGGHSRPC